MTPTDLMTDEEHEALIASEGATYTAWEWADRWLRAWHSAHPDEERDDLDIFMSSDYPDALFAGTGAEAAI